VVWSGVVTKQKAPIADGTRARIEEVALALLLERGYEGTPLRLIAERANVTTPALYWHFSSKSELCATVVAHEYERFSDVVSRAIVPSSPTGQLRSYVSAAVAYQIEHRRDAMGLGFDDLVASLPPEHHARIAEIQRPLHEQLRAIIKEGVRLGEFKVADPTLAAFAVTSICTYVFTWFKTGGRLGVDDLVDAYADMAVKLLGGAQ
jgi:AcrR family transcriptional regulator